MVRVEVKVAVAEEEATGVEWEVAAVVVATVVVTAVAAREVARAAAV